jgi:PAS domain S-box-containing protein
MDRLRAVVSDLPVVLFAVDRDGVFTLSEGRGLMALGLRPGEAVGRSIFEMYREYPHMLENVRGALSGHEVRTTVAFGDRAYEIQYAPLPDGEGGIGGVVGLAIDVTERKRSEDALQRQGELYEALLRAPTQAFDVIAADLRRGIVNDELVLHFQPQVSMRTRRLTALEALVRWRHPERGLLLPLEFVPAAERTGLIRQLTNWVLANALSECARWHEAAIDIPVAVNLSMRDLVDPDLPRTVMRLIHEAGARPEWLGVEVTESAAMADPHRAQENLAALGQFGVGVAIDDFGIGYSSLSYLHRLAAHQVKIDRSFVGEIAADRGSAVVVRACIDLGHDLGFEVVAEGVEDRGSWEILAALRCDTAQGFYMSRPMPADEVQLWLGSSRWARGAD